MGNITGCIVVSVITFGIYKLFELFVGRKERLAFIEKLTTLQEPLLLKGTLKLPSFSSGMSFSALKLGCLLVGMGLGLLLGYIINASTLSGFLGDDSDWRVHETASLIYGASVLLCGGLALVIAFIIELNIARKEKEK